MAEITDADLEAAKRRWAEERAERPAPSAVRFDRDSERIVVEFTNGAAFLVPARALEGLQKATPDDIADVELLGETGLHWERLDVDYTIQGLMAGIFGSRAFLEAQRRGGQSRSPAKIAASRVNGAKGGRPKKMG
ncbi:DUF2442 domain-containing protein [Rhizobium wuzhouense]|uniref:DUF2442 domain-containing protein n=1 Tax=Rhizobium wuzhouense TaxID=1986026 RepID=A0ABX5NZE2_9HYPH|nr:DUF2442 domain-containing protein [Rhizobium wuzhouense]PYB77056.1 DUF2442 domain-containing protein [Rhizobium wuzhouense]